MSRNTLQDMSDFMELRADHRIEGFDCGREPLNRYLLRYAWTNQQAAAAQTYVGLVGEAVIGYHTLAVGHVSREEAPERWTKGLARHPGADHAARASGCRSTLARSRRRQGS